jgi:hypothetical protein
MNRIMDKLKIDSAVTPTSVASTNVTGPYFRMDNLRKALFIITGAVMAASKTIVAQVYQATDAAAGSAKVLTAGIATITANTKCHKVLLTTRSCVATDSIIINGLTFTGDTSTVLATRHWKADGNDAADATALCACINDATYGVPGVLATLATDTVVLTAIEPGDAYITIGTIVGGTITPSTLESKAFIEVDASELDTANGFDHVALNIAVAAATVICSAAIVRSDERYTPTQYVADQYPSA